MKKTLGKILAIACTAIISVSLLIGCAANKQNSQQEPKKETAEVSKASDVQITGGWTLNNAEENGLPKEVKDALNKALENYTGVTVEPVALLSKQIVSGTNYCVLAKITPVTPDAAFHYGLVFFYEDLNKNAEITSIKDIDIASGDYGTVDLSKQELAGGWQTADPKYETPKGDYKEAFEKAAAACNCGKLIPVAYLGSQIVSGTNYSILCYNTLGGDSDPGKFVIVTVYEDLQGNAEITEMRDIDIAGMSKAR